MTTINWQERANRELTPSEVILIGMLEDLLPADYDSARVTFSSGNKSLSVEVEGDLQVRVQSEDEIIQLMKDQFDAQEVEET